ncbi:MAG TPA: hypothetical protein VFO99_19235, partial [Pyrinomonadaceae bacterium]|nr:hypothetical protein [Pyrinomonadaceae bacterium]
MGPGRRPNTPSKPRRMLGRNVFLTDNKLTGPAARTAPANVPISSIDYLLLSDVISGNASAHTHLPQPVPFPAVTPLSALDWEWCR